MEVWLDREMEQMDPRTFKMPMLTLSIAGIQPIIMERLLLDRQLLGHKLRMEISPQKTEIEIYQRQKLLSPLLRMLIQMQIELLAITLLVSHLFFFSFFIKINSVLNRKISFISISFNLFTLIIYLS
jgi:hypothetical protein